MPSHDDSRCHCLCFSRSPADLPLVEINVVEAIKTDGAPLFKIPKGYKNIGTKFQGTGGDRLICFKKCKQAYSLLREPIGEKIQRRNTNALSNPRPALFSSKTAALRILLPGWPLDLIILEHTYFLHLYAH